MSSPVVPLDHLTVPAFAFDSNDHILSWNPAAAQLYGIAGDEAIGQSILLFIAHEAIEDYRAAVQLVTETGSWHGELLTVTATYQPRLVETAWSRWSVGEHSCIVALHTDVTESRSRQNAERRHAVLSALRAAIFEVSRVPQIPATLSEACSDFLDQPHASEEIAFAGNGHTVLLVCSDGLRQEWYRLLLECYDFRVLNASNPVFLQNFLRDRRVPIHVALIAPRSSSDMVDEIWRVRPLLPIIALDTHQELTARIPSHPVLVVRSRMTARTLLHLVSLAITGEVGPLPD